MDTEEIILNEREMEDFIQILNDPPDASEELIKIMQLDKKETE